MIINIPNQAELYKFLKDINHYKQCGDPEGEFWKEDRSSFQSGGIGLSGIELPEPLDQVYLNLGRRGDFYRAFAVIRARRDWAFNGISNKLVDELKEKGYRFESTSDNGTGYLIDEDEHPSVAILEPKERYRDIGIGCNGAHLRELKSQAEFVKGIGQLETILNIFIKNVLASPHAIAHDIRKFPDIPVYFSF